MQKISIVIPIHNAKTTIQETIRSVKSQVVLPDEIICVDDNSDDGSSKLIVPILDEIGISYKIIRNPQTFGLARSYNLGIEQAHGELIIIMHADIILEPNAIELLVEPFLDDSVVGTTHKVIHPYEIWNQYNFWGKVFFARLVGKTYAGFDGKFDCFKKSAFEAINGFDTNHYHVAGEDGDFISKLNKLGKVIQTDATIIHIHTLDNRFGWQAIIKKQAQYSEAYGTNFRRGNIHGIKNLIITFFRELLVVGLFLPGINVFVTGLILIYSVLYTKILFISEYKNLRIFILPLFNIFLLFVSFIFSLRGFIYAKQQY